MGAMSSSNDLEADALRIKLEYGVWRERFDMSRAAWTLASNELKPALLLAGQDLVEAENWLLSPDANFSQLERQYIAKSVLQSSLRRQREHNELAEEMHETVQRRLRLILAMMTVILAILAPGMFNYAVIRSMQEPATAEQQQQAQAQQPAGQRPSPAATSSGTDEIGRAHV